MERKFANVKTIEDLKKIANSESFCEIFLKYA